MPKQPKPQSKQARTSTSRSKRVRLRSHDKGADIERGPKQQFMGHSGPHVVKECLVPWNAVHWRFFSYERCLIRYPGLWTNSMPKDQLGATEMHVFRM